MYCVIHMFLILYEKLLLLEFCSFYALYDLWGLSVVGAFLQLGPFCRLPAASPGGG